MSLIEKGAAPPPPPPPPTPPKAVPIVEKRPLPANLPPFQLPDPPGFPSSVADMKVVKGLGGSTGAKLVEDPATGKRYVLKKGKSAGHLREEALRRRRLPGVGPGMCPPIKYTRRPMGR
ncbi:MAG: hypothetical protein IPJ94_19560 [Chloroflexi bacterium]|nr:hypothetical protein [Chloroflexota bacterium]